MWKAGLRLPSALLNERSVRVLKQVESQIAVHYTCLPHLHLQSVSFNVSKLVTWGLIVWDGGYLFLASLQSQASKL